MDPAPSGLGMPWGGRLPVSRGKLTIGGRGALVSQRRL